METFWFTNPEAFQNRSFWFMGLHYIGMIDEIIGHWRMSQLHSFNLPRKGWVGLKFPTLYLLVIPLLTRSHPKIFSKNYLININPVVVGRKLIAIKIQHFTFMCQNIFRNWRQETKYYNKKCSHCSYHPGNSKDFCCCEPGNTDKNQIYMRNILVIQMTILTKYVFLINHNIAPVVQHCQ